MDENQCNLRWNNHTCTFVNLLDQFRIQELYCDATIACDGKVYPVHKVVLSACSTFFASIFYNTNHQNPVVVLQDVGKVQLENLLTYMYRGEVRIPHPDLPMFFKVAESLQVKGLAVPTPDRYALRQVHGSWHNSLCSPPEGVPSPEASVPHTPHLPYRHEIPNRPMQCHDIVPDVKQNEPDLPRSYEAEYTKHPQQSDLPLKRRSHVLEHAQNYRQENTHPKKPCEVEHIQHTWHEEGSLRSAQEVKQPPRKFSSSNDIHVEDKSSPVTGLIVSGSHGTFQNLVAAEEPRIKDEPQDSPDELEQNSLCIYEDIEHRQEDDDDFALKISDDQGNPSDSCRSSRTTTDHQQLELLDCRELGVESAAIREPNGTPPQTSAASQLRRELLRPLQHKSGLPQNQQPNMQSIPHPVIAPREPERPRREPPPLMKLPTVMNDCDPPRPLHNGVKEMQDNNHSSHLLVKAPPTYRSYTAPNHFSLQVHNQQLGPVMVNGGSPITEITDSQMNNILPQNDAPLNLSGQRKFLDDSEKKMKDPFLGKILTNRKKRLRGPKSWEYLVRLLKDPTTNPHLIRWENEATGVFRLVQPAAIAQRWGRRTGKHSSECLSYENFARGLRYHYATGALMPVSERSFVYKFGPKALRALEECDASSFPSI